MISLSDLLTRISVVYVLNGVKLTCTSTLMCSLCTRLSAGPSACQSTSVQLLASDAASLDAPGGILTVLSTLCVTVGESGDLNITPFYAHPICVFLPQFWQMNLGDRQ